MWKTREMSDCLTVFVATNSQFNYLVLQLWEYMCYSCSLFNDVTGIYCIIINITV